MQNVAYASKVRIERVKAPLRRAYLRVKSRPIVFGVHGEVARHYGIAPGTFTPRATTLDYLVAAAAG